MKLEEYYPSYLELRVNVDNREAFAYKKRLDIEREILPALGGKEIEAITVLDVRRLIKGWSDRGLSAKTMNNYLSLLRNMLRCAVLDQVALQHCPVEARRVLDTPETRAIERHEMAAVASALRHEAPHWRFAFRFALLTGLRVGELRALRRDAVAYNPTYDVTEMQVRQSTSGRFDTIGRTKGKARALPLTKPVVQLIETFHTGTEFMFADTRVGVRTYAKADAPLSYKAFDLAMRRVRERAGMPWLHWHSLRHTFATELNAQGVPPAHIQALLGHVDLRTTQRYTRQVAEPLGRAMATLDSWLPKSL